MDQPTVDGVNTFLVSKVAKEIGLTVVLSGLGGDEVFLGYSHLRKAASLEYLWRLFSGYLLKAGQLEYDYRYSKMHGMPVTGGRGFRGLKPWWDNGVPP